MIVIVKVETSIVCVYVKEFMMLKFIKVARVEFVMLKVIKAVGEREKNKNETYLNLFMSSTISLVTLKYELGITFTLEISTFHESNRC